jgi:hypothetical protein
MKKFLMVSAFVSMSLGLAATANASVELVPADSSASTKICIAAAQGNKFKVARAIEYAGVTKSYVNQEVTCNGVAINDFAAQYHNTNDQAQFVATDGSVSSKICIAAAQGNKLKFNRLIDQAGISKRYVSQKMTCNGMPVEEFVAEYGSVKAS